MAQLVSDGATHTEAGREQSVSTPLLEPHPGDPAHLYVPHEYAAVARILVVDDEPDFQTLFGYYLARLGHVVEYAGNGEQALAMMRAREYDLVLLDLRMPVLDGLAVLGEVQADSRLRQTPIIVVTAHSDQDTAVHCINEGAEEFLEKPIRPVVLTVRVNSVLLKRQQAQRQREILRVLKVERDRSDALLRELLPDAIADELKRTQAVAPKRHENVAVLFADLVGFTAQSERSDPADIHAALQDLVCAFEDIGERFGIEKIKTIGDSYMGAASLLEVCNDAVARCVGAAAEIVEAASRVGSGWQVRVGVDYGPVVAGIVGRRRYLYDIWGDTVNTAERVRACAEPNRIALSGRAWEEVRDDVSGNWRGPFALSGKPSLEVFQVEGFIAPGRLIPRG